MTSTGNRHVTSIPAYVLFFLLSVQALSQNFGNEWINYSRRYFKFPIYRESVYRIDSATLATVFDLSVTDPRNLQIFLKGEEQPVFIRGESDGIFNGGDYLEFFAGNLTSHLDSLVYHEIEYVPNPWQPIFSDTIYAFITVAPGVNGKRYSLETDTALGSYPAGQYVYAEKLRSFRDSYNTVQMYEEYTSDPRYTQSEGYGTIINKGGHNYHAFQGTPVYTTTPLPVYHTVAFTSNSREPGSFFDHQLQVKYSDKNGTVHILTDTLLTGFSPVRKQYLLSNQDLSGASEFSVSSVASPSFSAFGNQTYLHYFHTLYPSGLSFSNPQSLRFHADNNSGAVKTSYSFWGMAMNGSSSAALYDLTDEKRITTVNGGGFIRAVIPNGSGWRKFFLVSDSLVQKVKKITPAGENGFFTNYLASAGANSYVMIYHKALAQSAAEYKAYRESGQGGSYAVVFADIEQLFEQYAQGTPHHPAGVRNFLRHAYVLASRPKYVLLIGSATTPNIYPTWHSLNMIPTMGRPNSDNLLATGLATPGEFAFHPDIPIGRVAAINNAEVYAYLEKVKSFEAAGQAEWKKNVGHFIGGDSEPLSLLLGSFMKNYADLISDTLFGAQVRTFRKNSSQPIQVVLSDSIKDMVNAGTGLLTFFGHGSPYGFDQAIDEPQLYSNKDRYPFLFANSCFSGDIHDPNSVTVSKKFVFAKEKGSIGFLATTSLGFIYALNDYATHFYRSLTSSKYDQGIGDVIKEAAFLNSFSGMNEISFTGLDMTLHGDPAIRVSAGPLPDFAIDNKDVKFDVANADSIAIAIAYRNKGKAMYDTMIVSVERLFPNGDTSRNYYTVPAALFRDTVYVKVARGGNEGVGLNYFKIRIDQLNDIVETNEGNNETGSPIEVFVPGNDVIPVYPFDFAVVPATGSVTLKASTIDAYAPESGYRFEIDTCNCFIAPVATTVIVSRGGVIEWTADLPFKDSTVYFWRVTRDSIKPSDRISWRMSTFQTVSDKRGWGQAHFHQFSGNGYQLVTYKEDARQFIFENRLNTVNTRAGFHPFVNDGQQTYYFNNARMDSWSCTFNGWNFAVFDSISGEPLKAVNPNWPGHSEGSFGNCVCDKGQPHQFLFYFGRTNECTPNDLSWKSKMENFLQSVPANNYVLGFTTGNPSGNAEMSTYNESLYQAFESIGSGSIRTTPDTVAMVIFGKKGMNPGDAKERIGETHRTVLFTQDSIRTRWNSGYIASPVIGPARKWQSVHWRLSSLDASAGDTSILKVAGIKDDGTIDTLLTLDQDITDHTGLDGTIDANIYPYVKLIVLMRDITHRTSPQLKSWHILYDEVPECALNPTRIAALPRDSIQEGEKVSYRFPVENIGAASFGDSLLITYWIEDAQRQMVPLTEKLKQAPFGPGEVLVDTIDIDSYKLRGSNAIWINVNPPGHQRYQREQYYFNNVARVPFEVAADRKNPLLDVTFDGRRILNGDIVSAKPSILISLKDENKFLALNDTSAFTILLRAPGQSAPRRIHFAKDLQFTAAQLPRNSASILYTPELKVDGKYTLIAQASDRSNNKSGANDYVIEFEVNNKPTVTNVMNYPNPFTTSTRFVFTLTGSEIPEVFTIQILTVTGKVVREITRSELGTLRIGRNITEYAWDGRDEYGDRLANGVYLYRVRTKLNGQDLEKRASSADQFFNREYGKMVLVR